MTKINIVLFMPEIPGNTANIIRTCVGLNARLHLIKPYGFDLNLAEKVFKRGSTNYVNDVELIEYENFEEFENQNDNSAFYMLTRHGVNTYNQIDITKHDKNIFYIFGSESTGIEKKILKKYKDHTFRIPMDKKMRSLNLSNCAMLVAFDGARQLQFEGLSFEEPHKIDFWKEGEK
ncbi:MAG: TrmH family RNA methyltransferase [Mycoplasmatales bacterium]